MVQSITEKVAFELSVQDVHGGLFANPFVSVFELPVLKSVNV